jgi:putative DNA primase/helicase
MRADLTTILEGQAEPFLAALTSCPPEEALYQPLTFQVFTDHAPKPDPDPLADILFGCLDDMAEKLERLNDQGAGIFVSVNVTTGGRKKTNVRALRGWHTDLDLKDATEPFELGHLPLAPTIVVKTPGGWHLYWLTEAPMPCEDKDRRDEHEAELKAICVALKPYGADKRTCDVTRVLRLPGYFHKKGEPRLVELVTASGPRYTREQIREAFPLEVKAAKAKPAKKDEAPADRAQVLKRAEAYLAGVPWVKRNDGSSSTFSAALKTITRFNLTESEALELMVRVHNPKCDPAWSEAELGRKVADAWNVAKDSPDLGCALLEAPSSAGSHEDTGWPSEDDAPPVVSKPVAEDRPQVHGFEWGPKGLYKIGIRQVKGEDGKPTGETEPTREWIAPPFTLAGLVRDIDSHGWRVLLTWNDLDGHHHEEAVPFEMLSGEASELARTLGQGGMMLPPDPAPRKALLRYLCEAGRKVKRRVRLVDALGWHERAFVLPDGSTIGHAGELVRFAGESSALNRRSTSGTLEGWQSGVAAYAVGEPRLAFCLACAFAGPIMGMVRPDGGGGFNIQGFSTTGKSTVLGGAASVWHSPFPLPTWRATANGLEGIAASRNDGFLPLDELGQVEAKEAGSVAYMLANGSAKVRATKDGGNRSLRQWRFIFLSSGELGLEDKLSEDGKRPKAGQEVRVPDIPCPPSGMFESAHGFPSLGAFAEHLKESSQKHYGHAARAFLAHLVDEWDRRDALQARLKKMEAEWMAEHIPADAGGQVRRVGGRFALVAVAGELAQNMGILPWPEGESFKAAGVCFNAWLARRGSSGSSEIQRGIAGIVAFLQKHGQSRFDDWGEATTTPKNQEQGDATPSRAPKTINRAGTRRRSASMDGWDYYFTSEGWKEACQGSAPRDVAKACLDAGILDPDGSGKHSQSLTIPGHGKVRCYVIRAAKLAQHDESEAA